MKKIFRSLLINIVALIITTQILPSLTIENGFWGFMIASVVFMIANFLLTPLLKVILLPLNLLTLGLFAWASNVLTLYALVSFFPIFVLSPYFFPGSNWGGFDIPAMDLSTFQVALVAAFVIAIVTQILHWLVE